MKRIISFLSIAVLITSGIHAQRSMSANANNGTNIVEATPGGQRGGNTVPTNSPEPLTLAALAGGAAVAGGAAMRKRRKKNA